MKARADFGLEESMSKTGKRLSIEMPMCFLGQSELSLLLISIRRPKCPILQDRGRPHGREAGEPECELEAGPSYTSEEATHVGLREYPSLLVSYVEVVVVSCWWNVARSCLLLIAWIVRRADEPSRRLSVSCPAMATFLRLSARARSPVHAVVTFQGPAGTRLEATEQIVDR